MRAEVRTVIHMSCFMSTTEPSDWNASALRTRGSFSFKTFQEVCMLGDMDEGEYCLVFTDSSLTFGTFLTSLHLRSAAWWWGDYWWKSPLTVIRGTCILSHVTEYIIMVLSPAWRKENCYSIRQIEINLTIFCFLLWLWFIFIFDTASFSVWCSLCKKSSAVPVCCLKTL